MISLALLGVLQALFLPGFLLTVFALGKRQVSMKDVFLISTPLSILLNCYLVFALVSAKLFTQFTMLTVLALEALLLVYWLWQWQPREQPKAIHQETWQTTGLSTASVLKLLSFLPLLFVFKTVLGTAFTDSDAILSWHPWAVSWLTQAPAATGGYPPGLPIFYAVIYQIAGSSNLQVIAKMAVGYFPFFGLFCLWRLSGHFPKHKTALLMGALFYTYLILRGYEEPDFAFQGYTDPIIAAFSAYALYALSSWRNSVRSDASSNHRLLWLLILSLASIALFKQNGLVQLLVVLGIAFLYLLKHQLSISFASLSSAAVAIALGAAWYGYYYFFGDGFVRAASLLDPDVANRLHIAFKLTIYIVRPWFVLLMILGLLRNRALLQLTILYVTPLWLFWALLVSYDFRAAYPLLPMFALAAGFGLASFGEVVVAKWHAFHQRSQNEPWLWKARLTRALIVITALFLVLPWIQPDEKLLFENNQQRIKARGAPHYPPIEETLRQAATEARMISCDGGLLNLPHANQRVDWTSDCDHVHLQWLSKRDYKFLVWSPFGIGVTIKLQDIRDEATRAGVTYDIKQLPGDQYLITKL